MDNSYVEMIAFLSKMKAVLKQDFKFDNKRNIIKYKDKLGKAKIEYSSDLINGQGIILVLYDKIEVLRCEDKSEFFVKGNYVLCLPGEQKIISFTPGHWIEDILRLE